MFQPTPIPDISLGPSTAICLPCLEFNPSIWYVFFFFYISLPLLGFGGKGELTVPCCALGSMCTWSLMDAACIQQIFFMVLLQKYACDFLFHNNMYLDTYTRVLSSEIRFKNICIAKNVFLEFKFAHLNPFVDVVGGLGRIQWGGKACAFCEEAILHLQRSFCWPSRCLLVKGQGSISLCLLLLNSLKCHLFL